MRKLETYDDCRHCIEVDCGIPLKAEYVVERLRILSDTECAQTAKFAATWGEQHRQRVIEWFGRAAMELGRTPRS